MKCQYVGPHVQDLAEKMVASTDGLVYGPAAFGLSSSQMCVTADSEQAAEEHSFQYVIFKSALKSTSAALPPREDDPALSPDACRIHGIPIIEQRIFT